MKINHTKRLSDAQTSEPGCGNNAITTMQDPKAFQSMELPAARGSSANQKQDDPYLACFNSEYDAEKYAQTSTETILAARLTVIYNSSPKDWPTVNKWTVTDVLSATGFNRIMVSTIMAPALSTIALELDMSSAESVMALSIYLLATSFGPLLIGPLSEVYGRAPVLHFSNAWFLVWNIVCCFAKTKEALIAARFMAEFGASAIYALAGGVLGDIWRPEQRGKLLGVYSLIPLLGAAIGAIANNHVVDLTLAVLTMYWTDHRWFHGCTSYSQQKNRPQGDQSVTC